MDDATLPLAASVVAAYLAKNQTPASGLPALIETVHRALVGAAGAVLADSDDAPPKPAVSVRRSVTPGHLVCLEDGKKFASLKKHLRAAHDTDPGAYRAKWGLRADYPMTAPNYSAKRTGLAKAFGLGGRKPAVAAVESTLDPPPAKATAKRARRAKSVNAPGSPT